MALALPKRRGVRLMRGQDPERKRAQLFFYYYQPIRKLAETLSEIDFCFKCGCANQKLREAFWGQMGTLSARFFNKAIAGVNFCI